MHAMESLRFRYSQLFAFILLSSIIFMMIKSINSGMANFQDNFYKKDFLIETAVFLKVKLGDRVFPQVLLEKDGWMAHVTEKEIDYFQNAKPLKNKEEIAYKIAALDEFLSAQGITLLVVAAPSKASIYPDKMPAAIKPQAAGSKLDELISFMDNGKFPSVLDLGPVLRAARQKQDVYYKTNTHWNGYGAFVAYTTIINTLAREYPQIKPYKAEDLTLCTTDPVVQDLPAIMHANFITEPDAFFEPKVPMVHTLTSENDFGYNQFSSTSNCNLPTLLMFHDSFGDYYLNDYLSMNFSESHFVYNSGLRKTLTLQGLQQYKPDVVIIEVLERNIGMLENYLADIPPR